MRVPESAVNIAISSWIEFFQFPISLLIMPPKRYYKYWLWLFDWPRREEFGGGLYYVKVVEPK